MNQILLGNPPFSSKGWHWKRRRIDKAFTERELELMDAIMDGATTHKDMAARLIVERKTIQFMLGCMFRKTNTRNVADLILWKVKGEHYDRLE